jgi:RNA polymerase sigma factor (sigma-70 family)
MNSLDFVNFFEAVRNQDHAQAGSLAGRIEPYLRHVIRLRLRGRNLGHFLDSVDIYQSVLGDFLQAVGEGQVVLQTPRQMKRLLVMMAVHKIIDAARRERRHEGQSPDFGALADSLDTPGQQASQLELLERARACLSDPERELFDLRARGLEWKDVATRVGGNDHALRMKLTRALRRIRSQLDEKQSHVH